MDGALRAAHFDDMGLFVDAVDDAVSSTPRAAWGSMAVFLADRHSRPTGHLLGGR
jgi:hypothetical protein